MMTYEILKIINFMLRHGFYGNLKELREVAKPMVNLLNGANDVYLDIEDENLAGNIVDFIGVKRYFSSGSNDIIVQCKALICENLLLISQLEIDGKAQIFLSKFKCDLDMLMLQQQISSATPKTGDKDASAAPKEENQKGGLFGSFKMTLPNVGLDDENKNNNKSVEQKNIEFLEDISSSFNFEADDQDAYICVMFDLLLYKYPSLAKGVFELLVRLFTRKRTLLESLMSIQMLENPRSIWILGKVKKYSTELKKLIEDAEHWLNKTNKQSKNIKYRTCQIFKFFT